MTSRLETWLLHSQIDCGIRCLCIGHDRGRSNNAGSITLDDRAVHARGQAKIVSIHNEATHWVSLTKTIHHKGHEADKAQRSALKKLFWKKSGMLASRTHTIWNQVVRRTRTPIFVRLRVLVVKS